MGKFLFDGKKMKYFNPWQLILLLLLKIMAFTRRIRIQKFRKDPDPVGLVGSGSRKKLDRIRNTCVERKAKTYRRLKRLSSRIFSEFE